MLVDVVFVVGDLGMGGCGGGRMGGVRNESCVTDVLEDGSSGARCSTWEWVSGNVDVVWIHIWRVLWWDWD